jgi:hypothetical protein
MYKIFVDDSRNPETKHDNRDKSWTLCQSFDEFKKLIDEIVEKKETVKEISFDYILNDWNHNGADCFKVLACLIEDKKIPLPEKIYIHSEYPKAEENFRGVAMSLEHYLDIDIHMIKIHETGAQSIIKTWND